MNDQTSKWSDLLRSDRDDVPLDIIRFHMNLVLLNYSKDHTAIMLDSIQETFRAWEADGRPAFTNAAQVESFFSSRSVHDEDLAQLSVSNKAKRRHVLRRTACDVYGRLASLASSDWPFTQALKAHSPELARHWPEPGTGGYFSCLQESANAYWRLRDEHLRRARLGHVVSADASAVEASKRRELRNTTSLLRMKLALASQAEADLLDVPIEVMLHCAIVDDYDGHVYDALSSLHELWLEFSKPEFGAWDQVASFIAYWLKRRWAATGASLRGVLPDEIAEDVAAIRAFCDWTNMPQLSEFARIFRSCDGGVLPEDDVVEDTEKLGAYLDETEIWFRLHVVGDSEPVDIDF